YAEPPAPPPVQSQESRAVRSATLPNVPQPIVAQAFSFDPLKAKPRLDPFYANMVGIPYGSFLLFPEIGLSYGYDSNIYAERKNETSDMVTMLSPLFVAKSNWAEHKLNFGAGADLSRYRDHSSENTDDYWLAVGGQYDINPTANIFGNVSHTQTHEDRGSPDNIRGQNPTVLRIDEANLGAAKQFGKVSVKASLNQEKLDFSTPTGATYSYNDRDRTVDSLDARVGYAVTPSVETFVQAATDARNYDITLDHNGFKRSSDGHRIAVGAAFTPSAALKGEAFIGQMHQSYDDPLFTDLNKAYFGANLTWKPLAGTTASAFLGRSLEETTLAGSSGYVDTSVGANVEKVLNQDLLLNARLAYTRSEYQGIDRQDDTISAGAGVKYYVSPTVYLGADYSHLNRESNVKNAQREPYADYFRNQIMFSLGYTPGRKRLNIDGSSEGSVGEGTAGELHASFTPKLYYFNQANGFNNDWVQFLERYDYRDPSIGGDRGNGLIADVDLNLVYADAKRDILVLERSGFGENNQRTNLKADSDSIKFKAYNSIYTSATGGIGFLYNPDKVVGGTDPLYATGESSHVATFTFDSPNTLYSVKRNNSGASVEFKPAVFDSNGSVVVSYDGYTRKGNKVANYELPNALFTGGSTIEPMQWRGYSQPIDERSNRFAVNMSFTPRDLFNLNYEFSIDKFQNNASALTLGNVVDWMGIQSGSGNPHLDGNKADITMPLNFVADSSLITNSLRFSKQLGDSAILAAGYSTARLKQDSFTDIQLAQGYNDGKTGTDSGYVTGKLNISQSVGLEAFYRFNKRENNSTYPAGNLINPLYLDPYSTSSYERMVMPRINKIETSTYGLEASLYPQFLKSSWSLGWKHEDKDRDFTFGTDGSVSSPIMLYSAQSSSDEVYLKLVSRPAKGWTIRLTPSYLWADKTGLVTEPEKATQLKTQVSYSKPEWHELFVSGYYNYKQTENGLLGYSDYVVTGAGTTSTVDAFQPGTFGTAQAQKMNNTMQSAGLNLNMVPREALKLNLGYDWNQTDFSTYYFTSNRIRFHYLNVPESTYLTSLDFLILDNPSYKVDTHTLSAGGEWQLNKYTLSGLYSYSWSKGHNANGLGGLSLPAVDANVDNVLQTLSFGVEYALKRNLSLRGSYTYDNYKDHAYQAISGDMHTIMMGLNYRL
ncbi:MAG: hypothetical protein ACD_23C00036G0001, partial [uncultured bacterium]